MMRIFLWLLALFATAVGLAVAARFNAGNVVLFYPPYRIDISLNFFLLLSLLLFALIHILLNAIESARKMPSRVAAYRQQKNERDGDQALREAIKALFEGRFVQAEKAAGRSAKLPENVGAAALVGARAAHALHQFDRRDAYLESIRNNKDFKTARLVTTIELLVEDHQTQAALNAISELNASGTRHIHALRWALKANQQAKNWEEVLRLVRSLDKHRAIHPALSSRLRELAYEDLLSHHSQDPESVRRVWHKIPAEERQRPYLAVKAAGVFKEQGLDDAARALIARALEANWDDRLVRAYRQLAAEEGSPALLSQIELCENWEKKRPTDPELLLTLGALCLKQKLWGKAQRHLEQAVYYAVEPRMKQESHLKLAQLHEALNQPDEASLHYRESALAMLT